MGPLFILLLSVLFLTTAVQKLNIVRSMAVVAAAAFRGLSVMLDSELRDEDREDAFRAAGLALLVRLAGLSCRLALALAAAAAPVLVAATLNWVQANSVVNLVFRADFILATSLAIVLLVALARRTRTLGPADADAGTNYSMGEQLVHMLAFASPTLMKASAKLDDRLFSKRISHSPPMRPIFVTSLARAGTTALLNAFHGLPSIATHLYQDMPFLMAPLIWARVGGRRSSRVRPRERAHRDGLLIDLDTPEAFEEVFWRVLWPEKYGSDSISLWQADDIRKHACQAMERHFAKICSLRVESGCTATSVRYLSKNNANIARLRVLDRCFPGCAVVVPIRRPAAHAASMLRQHVNFLELHARDEFARRYMRDIGHLEFGALLRPIAFEGFDPGLLSPNQPDYWLRYWIAAFSEVRDHGSACQLVTQDELRARPQEAMEALCQALGLSVLEADFAPFFRSEPDLCEEGIFSSDLLREANQLYHDLAARSVVIGCAPRPTVLT